MSIKAKLNFLDGKMDEIRKLRAQIEIADGQYKQALQELFREQGIPENFALHEVGRAFLKDKSDEIIVP